MVGHKILDLVIMVRVHAGQYFDSAFGLAQYKPESPLGEEKYPERPSEARESKDNMWFVYILKCKNGDLYTGITNNLQRRFEEHVSGKGGHFTKSFVVEEILFSEEHSDKPSALKREAQIKGWTRKKKLALIKGEAELLKKL